MTCTLEDLNETILSAKERGAIHFKSIDCPLIQEWARRNLASQHSRRDVDQLLFNTFWLPGAMPESEMNKDPHQMFWLVLPQAHTYQNAKHEAEQIRALAKAVYEKNPRSYNQARKNLVDIGYADNLFDEIPRPE